MEKLQKQTVYSTRWFELVAKTAHPDDESYYALELADYVTIVATTRQKEFILVRQFRPAVEHWTLEFPAGMVDPGESPEQTARRELLEETGFVAHEMHLLGNLEPDTGRLSNRLWCYLAPDVMASEKDDVGEAGIETKLVTQAELMEAVGNSEFNHALHLAALLLTFTHGRLDWFELPSVS